MKGLRRRALSRETGEEVAYLAPLPIEASPLLCLLDNVAQLLIGQLQVLRQEVCPLFGCEPLEDIQHATIIVESVRCGVREEVRRGNTESLSLLCKGCTGSNVKAREKTPLYHKFTSMLNCTTSCFFTAILVGFYKTGQQWSQVSERTYEIYIDYTKHICRLTLYKSLIHQYKHNKRAKGIKQYGLWVGSTLLTQADCRDVCVWLCVCMVVHLLMCGSQILGYSSVLMLGFKDGRYNGRVGCRCVWRAKPESLENVRHSRKHIDSYLQMSTYYQSVIFLLPHKGACSQPLKKNHHVCKQMPWLTIKTGRPCALP